MLLAVDVGNTNTVLGVCEGGVVRDAFRITTPPTWTRDDVGLLVRGLLDGVGYAPRPGARLAGGAVMCSVVPSVTAAWEACLESLFGEPPVVVTARTAVGLEILYRDPYSVGGDRLADAMAVLRYYSAPAIVVDLGTATTFDVIDSRGRYLGGVIAPGVVTGASELFRRAARLAAVELSIPARVVGQSTEESIQSGVMFGAGAQVDGIVRRIIAEQGFAPTVIATGGLAPLVARVSETIAIVDEDLTIKGLVAIYDAVRGANAPGGTSAA